MTSPTVDPAMSITAFVQQRNREKAIFTAGPASLLPENIVGLRSCFGRGDSDYDRLEGRVLGALATMSGHNRVVRLQGSASLALEVAVLNFVSGRVLIVRSGYYSERLWGFAGQAQKGLGHITAIDVCPHDAVDQVSAPYDWVISCYTETSRGLRVDIDALEALKRRTGAQLLLDATASIGLETGHSVADVLAYSSCKGLFGLTGASFIACNSSPQLPVPFFALAFDTHAEKRTTGPYHALASLDSVLPRHNEIKQSVIENKKRFVRDFGEFLMIGEASQPLLCTWVSCRIRSSDDRAVLYEPRDLPSGSVVCHLGEAHLGAHAKGNIQELLEHST